MKTEDRAEWLQENVTHPSVILSGALRSRRISFVSSKIPHEAFFSSSNHTFCMIQQIPREGVAQHQRITTATIAHNEIPLEVSATDLIGGRAAPDRFGIRGATRW